MLDLPRAVSVPQELARRVLPVMCVVLGLGVAAAATVHDRGDADHTPVRFVKPDRTMESLAPEKTDVRLVSGQSVRYAASRDAALAAAGRELIFDAPAAPSAGRLAHHKTVRMLVTAYCPCKKCCGPSARGVTASGKPVTWHGGRFVAADTRLLPFGTKLVIPGYADGRPVEVIDTGSAIQGNHLDVFFPTHRQATEWGRKWVSVSWGE